MNTVRRALSILFLLASSPLTLGEIAARTGIHKATASRLMKTLREQGFVRVAGTRYHLGYAVFSLANQVAEQIDMRQAARPYLERLWALTGETVHLAILDGQEVVYVDKILSRHPIGMYSQVGKRAPAYCTGLGKALLAHMPSPAKLVRAIAFRRHTETTLATPEELLQDLAETRRRGYALDNHEHEPEIHCIAAPVFHFDGTVAGAISVAATRSRMTREQLLSYVPDLLKTVRELSAELGYQGGAAPR
jgi:IclR family transcriptional regulator, KDG regulon repressor